MKRAVACNITLVDGVGKLKRVHPEKQQQFGERCRDVFDVYCFRVLTSMLTQSILFLVEKENIQLLPKFAASVEPLPQTVIGHELPHARSCLGFIYSPKWDKLKQTLDLRLSDLYHSTVPISRIHELEKISKYLLFFMEWTANYLMEPMSFRLFTCSYEYKLLTNFHQKMCVIK
jgi:hypothetical protein